MDNKFQFGKVLQKWEQTKRELPVVLANDAQKFFLSSFRLQGWNDGTFHPWATPQRRIPGTPEYKYPKNKKLGRRTSATLVRSGRLRQAVANMMRNPDSIVSFQRIKLVLDIPYASYLNDGTAHMPARKLVGDSPTLRQIQTDKIKTAMGSIFKN